VPKDSPLSGYKLTLGSRRASGQALKERYPSGVEQVYIEVPCLYLAEHMCELALGFPARQAVGEGREPHELGPGDRPGGEGGGRLGPERWLSGEMVVEDGEFRPGLPHRPSAISQGSLQVGLGLERSQ